MHSSPAPSFLTARDVAARYGISVATVWRWSARNDGSFPSPIKLGRGCTRWRLSDLEAFEVRLEAGQ